MSNVYIFNLNQQGIFSLQINGKGVVQMLGTPPKPTKITMDNPLKGS